MSSSKTAKLAVVSINRDKYSETFIHDSYDFFPCEKVLLYGNYLPDHYAQSRTLEGFPIPKAKWQLLRGRMTEAMQQEFNLTAWLKQYKPQAILAHYGPSGVAMAGIAGELGLPLVVHFHGYDAYREDILGRYGAEYRVMFGAASALVVVSEDMRRQLLALGAPPEKLHLLHYGVDVAGFVPEPYPAGTPYYVFIGRFVAKKSPELLIQAFAEVAKVIPAARLTMAGDGELLERCKNLALELGLGDRVDFPGALARDAVADLYARAHALVLPSVRDALGDSEGTPLVVLEAGASGRPVVATRHGGIPDVIRSGENGLLVEEGDVLALAEAMLAIAADATRAGEMGKAGRAIVEADFSQATYHRRLWELLR
jgi:colanic acid/amylovoran biosynthesis glycosyltransferase